MKRILIPVVLAALAATQTFAQDPRPAQWDTGHSKTSEIQQKSRAKNDTGLGDGVILSVSEPEGAAAAAFARWHFAQGERGEGASRFATD